MDAEMRAALSPDCHMTPVFDERSFHSPLYHSPTHDPQGSLYRTSAGTAAHQRFSVLHSVSVHTGHADAAQR